MKINEFSSELDEGIWDAIKKGAANAAAAASSHIDRNANAYSGLARGLGAHDLEHSLSHQAEKNFQQKRQEVTQARSQAQMQVKPNPNRASNMPTQGQTSQTPQKEPALRPGEKFMIIDPRSKGKYYKTNAGWVNELNQKIVDPTQVQALEKMADNQTGTFIPAPPSPQTPYKMAPSYQRRMQARANRRPKQEPQPTEESQVNEISKNLAGNYYAKATKQHTDKVGVRPDLYNRIVGNRSTNNEELEMTESINKAKKLINEYTVKEMAVRRLKKEKLEEAKNKKKKNSLDTPRTGKEWHKTVNDPLPKDKPTLNQVLAPTYGGKAKRN